jgi:hypothetical protein
VKTLHFLSTSPRGDRSMTCHSILYMTNAEIATCAIGGGNGYDASAKILCFYRVPYPSMQQSQRHMFLYG